jgi:hypothetical protein
MTDYRKPVECPSCKETRWVLQSNLRNIKRKPFYTGLCKACFEAQPKLSGRQQITHGDAKTRLCQIWYGIRRRCVTGSCRFSRRYKDRGIELCEEWHDYENFKTWAMRNGYEENKTIDRIDVNGNYTPDNCQWLTPSEHNRKDKSKPVQCIETGVIYPSASQASLVMNLAKSAVSQAIRTGYAAGRLHWKFYKTEIQE